MHFGYILLVYWVTDYVSLGQFMLSLSKRLTCR